MREMKKSRGGIHMKITHTLAYKKAFNEYMRHGTPIELSLKAAAQEHPTTHYIWRTRGDNRVRASHAANNGRIFSRDNPPSTGHPGQDHGCRCTAEPYVRGESEFAYQAMLSGAQDSPVKWAGIDFLKHFFSDNPKDKTLSETGHLAGVINFYFYHIFDRGMHTYDRLNAQIIDAARKHSHGAFSYDFNNSYDEFRKYLYVFGGGAVSGVFTGTVRHKNSMLYIQGSVDYHYSDIFTDIFGERQRAIGTSDPAAASPKLLKETEHGGTYYNITGEWRTSYSAEAKADKRTSRYQWD
jgi:SPP1 gp7 family putative phage head morphogenesis protein